MLPGWPTLTASPTRGSLHDDKIEPSVARQVADQSLQGRPPEPTSRKARSATFEDSLRDPVQLMPSLALRPNGGPANAVLRSLWQLLLVRNAPADGKRRRVLSTNVGTVRHECPRHAARKGPPQLVNQGLLVRYHPLPRQALDTF